MDSQLFSQLFSSTALLHEVIFFFNLQRNAVARQVAGEIACATPRLRNLTCNKKLRCECNKK